MYRRLSLGWTGSAAQWRMLNRLMGGMAIFLFALVVTVHTNVSFIFGITTKPGWHSTIISPFFVLGAIYQGVAAMLVFAVVFRKMFHLQKFMRREHFQSASRFLLALACFWFYAMCIEHLFAFYTNEPAEMAVVRDKFFGEYSVLFWIMFTLNFPLPLVILSFPRFRTPFKLGVLGVLINIGMWLERFLIIVPSGANPYLPWGYGHYSPSWVEWSITAGWFAGFTLLLLVFARHFPILTMWEVKEDLEKGEKAAPAEEEASPAGSSPSLVAATGD